MTEILINPDKYKLVLIGWSNPGRWDFVTAPDKWFAIKMGDLIPTATNKKRINIDDSLFRHWAPQVVLSHWLRSRDIKFIMWNSLRTWCYRHTVLHKEILSIKEFYKPMICHIDHLTEKKEFISKTDDHPNQKSHRDWAHDIINFYRRSIVTGKQIGRAHV